MPTVLSERDVAYLDDCCREKIDDIEECFYVTKEKEVTGETQEEDEYYQQCLWDSKSYAIVCIERFFHDKTMYCGGAVPKRLLQAPAYVSMVINTDVMEGVDAAYEALQKSGHKVTWPTDDIMTVPREVKFVISILNHCKVMEIPKVFEAGLMLMYLEICEGVHVNRR